MAEIIETKTVQSQQETVEIPSFNPVVPLNGSDTFVRADFSNVTRVDGELVGQAHRATFIFTEAEVRAELPSDELPDFDTLYLGISKLLHKLRKAREQQ